MRTGSAFAGSARPSRGAHALVSILLGLSIGAHAGEPERLINGVVYKVEGTTLTVAPETGDTLALVHTDRATKFQSGDAAARLKDVALGQRVEIQAVGQHGVLLAIVVKLPPAKGRADAGDVPKKEADSPKR